MLRPMENRTMNRRRRASRLGWVAPALFFVACDGSLPMEPIGPIPGGRLAGVVVPGDIQDWSFTEAFETYALETRPSQPYSVTTWGVASGENFYVPTRDPKEKAWVQYVLSDERVRLQVGERVYERRAVRVTDPAEFKRIIPRLAEKYEIESRSDEELRDVWLFRLDPR